MTVTPLFEFLAIVEKEYGLTDRVQSAGEELTSSISRGVR